MDHPSANGTFDPARRRLCPDGACVGVVGPDGRCRECRRTEAQAAAGAEVELEAAPPDVSSAAEPTPAAATSQGGGFDPKRRLCDDGTCVGVVGSDGVCRVCGRRSN
jgi:hypothetical protein